MTEGIKHDTDKDRWDLLPIDAARGVVKVLTLGAAKYGARNWEKGIVYSRLYAAALRHLSAWFDGQDIDAESGQPHLACAACEVFFLLAFGLRGRTDLDDRPSRGPSFAERCSEFVDCLGERLKNNERSAAEHPDEGSRAAANGRVGAYRNALVEFERCFLK